MKKKFLLRYESDFERFLNWTVYRWQLHQMSRHRCTAIKEIHGRLFQGKRSNKNLNIQIYTLYLLLPRFLVVHCQQGIRKYFSLIIFNSRFSSLQKREFNYRLKIQSLKHLSKFVPSLFHYRFLIIHRTLDRFNYSRINLAYSWTIDYVYIRLTRVNETTPIVNQLIIVGIHR